MSKFFIHLLIGVLVICIFMYPTNKPLMVEEKIITMWSDVKKKYYSTIRAEKRAVRYITPRGHL